MTRLVDLLASVPSDYANIAVSGLSSNSREVKQGDVFIALQGLRHDARAFIPQAIAQGAVAVLCQADDALYLVNAVPVISVPNLPLLLGDIAARFYQQPSQAFEVVAVTGTNGKTSCAQLLAQACQSLGLTSAVLGTLGNGLVGDIEPSTHTTLEALQLQKKLADFRDAQVQVVAMEASSHGLVQGRLNATQIKTAIFTNLTRDHLDYHGSMAAYQQAKALLFQWPTLTTAIFNADDAASRDYQALVAASVRCWTYSQQADSTADFVALAVEPSLHGLTLTLKTPFGEVKLHSPLLGRFNVSNLLAVLAGLLSLNISLENAITALAQVPPVRGRMQCLSNGHLTAVVDYAHTPDALEKVLQSLREHTQGQLWCVFGCGGDRDTGKRPIMGEIATRLADRVIITADNPRSESVETIINDIMVGVSNPALVVVNAERQQAIDYALTHAKAGDLVLIAGKGHEDYQEINGIRHYFDDVEVVKHAFAKMN